MDREDPRVHGDRKDREAPEVNPGFDLNDALRTDT